MRKYISVVAVSVLMIILFGIVIVKGAGSPITSISWKQPIISIKVTGEIVDSDNFWITDSTVISKVASNMNLNYDKTNAGYVQDFLDKFNQLPYLDRVLYGVWNKGTVEYDLQQKLLGK